MFKFIAFFSILIFASLVTFAQTGSISGVVRFGTDTFLHDARVEIVQTRTAVRTDAEGRYRFDNVAAGRYTLLVHLEGFADATRSIAVAAGENVQADFQLTISSISEQVTVTAAGTEQSVFDSFQTVNSVGSTRITERAATSIGEVLEHETGVAKRSFGPGSARPIIRGFDGDRVLVLQDGVRSGSIGSQSGDHGEAIDPLAAERIEVVKGPGTLLYGSNAIGGVVNVIGHHENDFHPGLRGFFTGVAGTADKQAGLSGGVEYGVKNWQFRGNFGSQRTSDYDTPIGRIPNSSSRSNNFSLGTGYYGDKAFLGGTYSYDARRYGIPFAGEFHHHDDEEGADEEEIDIDIRSVRHNLRFTGGFRNLTNPFVSGINYNVDHTDYQHQEIATHDGVDEIGTVFDNRTFSYRSMFEQQKMGVLTGRFGFEGFHRKYEVVGEEQLIEGEIKHNAFSVFALEEIDLEAVKFQLGGRVESNRFRPANPDLLGRSFTAFSGGAGINVGLWKGGSFVANYTYSSRAPALEELYNNGPHVGNITFEIGNPNLGIERANGIDLSLRHNSNRFKLLADLYYYGINNFVFLAYQDEDGDGVIDTEDGLPIARYEQSKAGYLGGELRADVTFNDYFGAFIGLDRVRAKLIDEGLNVPRIPPARARIGLDIRYKDLSVRPEAVFAGRQDKLYPLETPTAGYGIFNVGASYTIGRPHHAHVISVNGHNLTDKLYRNHSSFIKDLMPEIGRGVRIGYTVRFF